MVLRYDFKIKIVYCHTCSICISSSYEWNLDEPLALLKSAPNDVVALDFPSEFWDFEDQCHIKVHIERLNSKQPRWELSIVYESVDFWASGTTTQRASSRVVFSQGP